MLRRMARRAAKSEGEGGGKRVAVDPGRLDADTSHRGNVNTRNEVANGTRAVPSFPEGAAGWL